MGKHHNPYAPEFRAQMVELVKAGRSPEELALEFEPTAQRRSLRPEARCRWRGCRRRSLQRHDSRFRFAQRVVRCSGHPRGTPSGKRGAEDAPRQVKLSSASPLPYVLDATAVVFQHLGQERPDFDGLE